MKEGPLKGTITPSPEASAPVRLSLWRRARQTVAFRLSAIMAAIVGVGVAIAAPASATSSTDLTGGNAATLTNDLKNFFTGTLEGELIGIAVVIMAFWMLYRAVRRVISR